MIRISPIHICDNCGDINTRTQMSCGTCGVIFKHDANGECVPGSLTVERLRQVLAMSDGVEKHQLTRTEVRAYKRHHRFPC